MSRKLEVNHVSKSFKETEALKDIDFTIEGNKIVGLIGRNGAGKTTLLSIIAGLRKVNQGEVKLNGKPVFDNQQAMQDVVFLSDSHQTSSLKIREILETTKKYRPHFDETYAKELLQKFDLPEGKTVDALSKGMRSSFYVVLGLASRAPITIFDETYSGMDAPTRKKFYNEVLDDQSEHPRLFILSSHLVSEMDYLFDEVVMIHEGEVRIHDDVESISLKGQVVVGESSTVDAFVSNKKVLNEDRLGPTKSATIYGELTEEERQLAKEKGLELSNVPLQDLFIHLTGGDAS